MQPAPQIVLNYRPREYFKKFHGRIQRHAIIVCHRRAGKTVAVVNDMVHRALSTIKKKWFGAYIAPYKDQARTISWAYLKDAVRDIPGIKINETQTYITFPNGSIIRVFGADNADALRGLYFDLVVLDEAADIKQKVWTEIIRPALADRRGSAIFMGTPKGKNWFHRQWVKAQDSESWFVMKLTVDDTGIIPRAELDEIRADLDEAEFNQEFMCSWEGSLRGAYYTKQMEVVKAGENIRRVAHNPNFKVHAAMDVGRRDATTVWFWQYVDGWVNVIDYFEETGLDAEQTCDYLQTRPYRYETVWLPHDAFHRTWQSKKSGFDTFIDRGLPARRVPNPDKGNRVYHGIDIVRKVLRTYPIRFDDGKQVSRGVESLWNYSRRYDRDRQVYADEPNHDHWSHGADAFRYLCTVLDPTEIARSLDDAVRAGRVAGTLSESAVNTQIQIAPLTLSEMQKHHQRGLERRARFEHKGRN